MSAIGSERDDPGRIGDGSRRLAEQGHQQFSQRPDGAALLIGAGSTKVAGQRTMGEPPVAADVLPSGRGAPLAQSIPAVDEKSGFELVVTRVGPSQATMAVMPRVLRRTRRCREMPVSSASSLRDSPSTPVA